MSGGICFVFLSNIDNAPYFKVYRDCIDVPYDIIYWDRRNVQEDTGAVKAYKYQKKIKNKFQLLLGYYGFRRFAIRTIKKNKYDKLIFLTSNTGVILEPFVTRNYKGKYIFDIRDYWKEKYRLYYNTESKLISNSFFSCISSPDFVSFLPKHDYVLTHNIREDICHESFVKKKEIQGPFVLSCVGRQKWIDFDKRVIDFFANDERFILHFAGERYGSLEGYCKENSYRNIVVEDIFDEESTLSKFENADAVLNLYGMGHPSVDYAISNKLYLSAELKLPIVVCPNTTMAKMAHKYHIGIDVDLDDEKSKEKLYKYLLSYRTSDFEAGCIALLTDAKNDMNHFENEIRRFVNS